MRNFKVVRNMSSLDSLSQDVPLPSISSVLLPYLPKKMSKKDKLAMESTEKLSEQMKTIPKVKLKQVFCNKVKEMNRMI